MKPKVPQPDSTSVLNDAVDQVSQVLLGKETSIKLAFCCLLAKGHLLIEDMPGMGKTTLAHALAQSLGIKFNRVQFTSDMLPADILGTNIFDQAKSTFRFHPGPIFTHLLLADEINRANPKTQSALLEAMAEKQVSIEGKTWQLMSPFFVIATQNPLSQIGTFPLPESQLDRFLMRLSLGYPSDLAERQLLQSLHTNQPDLAAVISDEQLLGYQSCLADVHASESLLDYVQALLANTRNHKDLAYGLSPRGAQALMMAARAWCFLAGRDYLIPEDIQAVAASVFVHRLSLAAESIEAAEQIVEQLLASTPV
ncbi:MAG: MoxR family ATPase [Cellvibrionales bacterium]|nr:MoxR family ATPase [Cellvibrionales bacterium]